MPRVLRALREWLELRARLRDERRFHLDQAVADFRALGLSRYEATRRAHARLGSKRHLKRALHEIGGDWGGLIHLIHAHRVLASVWLQPAVLVASIAAMLVLSPAPRVIVESILDRPLTARAGQTLFLVIQVPWPYSPAISAQEFEALHRIPALHRISRFGAVYARGDVASGAQASSIESAARFVTGNPHIAVVTQFELERIEMGPAFVVWALLAICACFTLHSHLPARGKGRWLLYVLFAGLLHLLASLAAFALSDQLWKPIGFECGPFFLVYLLASATQYLGWRLDLRLRCPVCFERLLLSSTTGAAGCMLLSAAVTESICAHGHGVLVETRWSRRFRRESSPLEELLHA